MIYQIEFLTLVFFSISLIFMMFDYLRFKQLQLIFAGYTFITLGSLAAFFANIYQGNIMNILSVILMSLFAGWFFAKAARSANVRILNVKKRTRKHI